MFRVKYLFLIGFLTAGINALTQVTSFTTDPTKFVGQVEKHLASFDRKDAKAFATKFLPVWNAADASSKSRVIAMSNSMTQRKLRPYPEFKIYWSAVYELLGGTSPDIAKFDQWHAILEKLIAAKQANRFVDFLQSSAGLIAEQTIFQSTVLSWKVRNGAYSFAFEDNNGQIILEGVRISCYANDDSTFIEGLSGNYSPLSGVLLSTGGKFYWTRYNLPTTETFAELSTAKMNLKSAAFRADSVTLTTPFFDKPVLGVLDEKVLRINRSGKSEYPNFRSYNQDNLIPGIAEGVDYKGGFSLVGPDFVGSGIPERQATLYFSNGGDKPLLRVSAASFNITQDKISANPVRVSFLVNQDSITHPALSLEYIFKTKTATLSRPKEGLGQSPFSNSYQGLRMYVDALYWTMGDSLLNFGSLFGSSITEARFLSNNYIDKDAYRRLQGVGSTNPADMVADFAYKYDEFVLDAPKLATGIMLTMDDAKPIFYNLANLGLIDYDPNRNKVYIKEQLFQLVNGIRGKSDYDDIVFVSDTKDAKGKKYNATLNLKNLNLDINGLKRVTLSESQFVRIYPDSTQTIKVFRNRAMTFGGIIAAGSTEYFGKEFFFDYEKFKLDLLACDSMRVRVWPFEQQQGQVRLTTVIEEVLGSIQIDHPTNKNGSNRKYHDFPKLKVEKETYVYYDKIYKGVYNRNDFKFIIKPFELDSLDNFDRDHLAFDGVLKSAGIFPDFNEKLKVMKDYSLGFIRKVPESGMEMYKDKSMFKNTMTLSSKGLQGDGKIEFLTSTAISDAFTFFPDSTAGIAHTYDNVEATKPKAVPKVKGTNVYVKYVPAEKILTASSVNPKQPLKFFEKEEASLRGRLTLSPEGMNGRGKMFFENAIMSARKFSYTTHNIKSDTCEFELISGDLGDLMMDTKNLIGDVDFKERMGKFKSNGANDPIVFKDNQYIAYMDEFKWYMDMDDIELVKKTGLTVESSEFERPNFYSTHPKQDSLSFMAPFARFNVNTRDIRCSKVPYIDVADARIVPDSGIVIIHKKAVLETLKNAEIFANNVTKNHHIVNATVEVKAKRSYLASGDYFYVDETGKDYKIAFARIEPDTAYQTTAKGRIEEKESFRMSPNFEFYGNVELYASNKFLVFDGATRITHNCNTISRNWMNFRSEIDPNNIIIPVGEDLKDLDGNPIGAGLVWSIDSSKVYSTFLSMKGNKDDFNVMTASGFLLYNKGAKEYRISNKEKLEEVSLPGNFVSLHTDLCLVSGDGRMNLEEGLGQVKLNNIGSVKYNMADNSITMSGAMGLAFPFVDNSSDKMAAKMKAATGLEVLDISRTFYKKALAEILSVEEADKIEADISLRGEIRGRFPQALLSPMFIGDINLKWNAEEEVFMNDGKIGVINVNRDMILKYFTGYVVIKPQRGSGREKVRNSISIYIEVDDKNWYYYEYLGGDLFVISSDNDFMKPLTESKDDKLKFKGEKGERDLTIRPLSDRSRVSRIKRYFEE